MHIRIGARKLFLFLLITAVVNADRMKEVPLACDVNVCCVVLDASFEDVSCEQQGFVIHVINAHYGYSNRDVSESCSIEQNDCLVSVPLHSITYYNKILDRCNDKEHCDKSLRSETLDHPTSCDLFTQNGNDYVLIQFYCLPPEVILETVDVCIKTYRQGAINCTGNRVIQIVGAILGFQPYTDDLCTPGVGRCRIQPDLDHLEDIRFNCQGQNICQFNVTTSIIRDDHTCKLLKYTFETVAYYCSENSGTLVTGIGECKPTSAAPSTVRVTSVTHSSSSSLSASSTSGGATFTSDTSTNTTVDNMGNVSTTVTDTPSTDITGIIVGCVVGGVVLIILLLLLIFIIWRRRNAEDTSKRRGNNSANGVNGLSPNGVTTMVKCDTPQGMTHSDKEYDATPLSDNSSIPTYSLGNHPATALYDLAQDLPQPPVYWLAQEPSIPADTLAREPLADFYSEVEDLAEEPYLSLYSNSGFSKEIDKSNPGIYVNVTEPSNAAYSLVQKTYSSTHQKVEDPVGSASTPVNKFKLPVNKFKFTKVKADKEEEKVSALTRHQSVQRPPEDDLVLRENSLYVATETHSQNDAVDELTLTENDLYV